MAQERENWTHDGSTLALIPKASTDVNPGDVVVMPRKSDPVSISALGATAGRIEPIAAAREGQWAVGVADGLFTSAAVGATLYATPTQDGAMLVKRRGVVRLAVSNTAGKVGDLVRYSSGASGAQVFVIDNTRPGYAVARVAKDFSGATANDPQDCELIELPIGGPNLYHFLENRVLFGCQVHQHSAAGARSQNVAVGWSSTTVGGAAGDQNIIILQNRVVSNIASNYTLDVGDSSVAGQSAARFRYVVARSGGFGSRTCSGVHSAFASYTATGISALMMVPTTMTAGEIPIALLINFSFPQSYTNGLILNIRGPAVIPRRRSSWGI